MVEDDDADDTDEAVKSPDEEGDPEPIGDPRGRCQEMKCGEVSGECNIAHSGVLAWI